jgi:hypothetical protein
MMKKVNVKANTPVHGVDITPLIGKFSNRQMTEDQIYRCLVGGATVDEILPNGDIVRLNFTNYNKDNGGKIVVDPTKLGFKPQLEKAVEEAVKQAKGEIKNEAVEVKSTEELVKESINEAKEETKVEETTTEVPVKEETKVDDLAPAEEVVTAEETKVEETTTEVPVKEAVKPQINVNTRRQHRK